MTSHELARKLLEGPDVRVVTRGFDEFDYDDIADPKIIEIVCHDDEPTGGSRSGRHKDAWKDEDGEAAKAVLINFPD